MIHLQSGWRRFTLLYIYIGMQCVCRAQVQPIAIDSQQIQTPLPKVGIQEEVRDTLLATVRLNRVDLETIFPVLLLGDVGELELSFDDLTGGVKDYYYTFTHCNRNWEPSPLSTYDFLDGFEENRIENYQFSFGTLQSYTHYSVKFPNDDVQFLVSGNYVLRIWEGDNRDTAVITKRFIIWENGVSISGDAMRPNLIPYRNEYQEVNFTVNISNTDIMNAFDEVSVSILQNGRWETERTNVQPRMISNSVLTYDQDDIVFEGGKEYRDFDTRTLKFQSDRIVRNETRNGVYHSYINVEESQIFQKYMYRKDANGQFVIHADLANNVNTEADYSRVHFTLNYPYMISSGQVYAMGLGLPNGKMPLQYDYDKQQYTGSAYLKQGYYNYLYIVQEPNGNITPVYTEGNTFETENDYQIIVYHHIFDRNYDSIIGYAVVNSLR